MTDSPLLMRALLIGLLVQLSVGCARRLPEYQKPIARTPIQTVRTTAYTHTEKDHRKHGRHNAIGDSLQAKGIKSAAADWSRWPAGTLFRIRETGELYRVDDYGWALAGTNTIDLYKSTRSEMNAWGVRRVTIENLQWGDPERSIRILEGRSKFRHVRRMLRGFKEKGAFDFPPLNPVVAGVQKPGRKS